MISSVQYLETTYARHVGLLRAAFVSDVGLINTIALSAQFVGRSTLISTPAFSTLAFSATPHQA